MRGDHGIEHQAEAVAQGRRGANQLQPFEKAHDGWLVGVADAQRPARRRTGPRGKRGTRRRARDRRAGPGSGRARCADRLPARGRRPRRWRTGAPRAAAACGCRAPTDRPRARPAPRRCTCASCAAPRPAPRSQHATTPPVTSPWPPRYLVALWMTHAAPRLSGWIRYGVVNVESTRTGTPWRWPSVDDGVRGRRRARAGSRRPRAAAPLGVLAASRRSSAARSKTSTKLDRHALLAPACCRAA